jgi:hypothetical protein
MFDHPGGPWTAITVLLFHAAGPFMSAEMFKRLCLAVLLVSVAVGLIGRYG